MSVSEQGTTHAPTLEKFAQMDSRQFREVTSQYQQAISQLTENVTELVDQGWITSLQGLGIIGCATSQVYATFAFHGQPSLADVWAKVTNGSSGSSQGRSTSN